MTQRKRSTNATGQRLNLAHKLLVILVAVTLTACSGSSLVENTSTQPSQETSNSPTADQPVLIVRESGGCIRIGPNCFVYSLLANGTVNAYRGSIGTDSVDISSPENTGNIDTGEVEGWIAAVEDENFEALLSSLPAGNCAGCVDGIDYEYKVSTSNQTVTIKSLDYKFDTNFTFFAITNSLYEAMRETAPLPIQQR